MINPTMMTKLMTVEQVSGKVSKGFWLREKEASCQVLWPKHEINQNSVCQKRLWINANKIMFIKGFEQMQSKLNQMFVKDFEQIQ